MNSNYFSASPGEMEFVQQQDQNQNSVSAYSRTNESAKNGASTFTMQVNSNVMAGSGIRQGDTVVVEKSGLAGNGRIIIALLDGELLIRRFEINNHKIRLVPDANSVAPIEIHPGSSFSIWGVVTYVIKNL
jgi:DNA polymerase V